MIVIASITVISDCRLCFLINFIVFHPFKMSDTTRDKIMVAEEVAEEDRSLAETFKGPIVNSSRGVEIKRL